MKFLPDAYRPRLMTGHFQFFLYNTPVPYMGARLGLHASETNRPAR